MECFVPANDSIPELPEDSNSGESTLMYRRWDTSSAGIMLLGESVVISVIDILKDRDSYIDGTEVQQLFTLTGRRLTTVQVLKINELELKS